MNLRQLLYFKTIVECNSISAASEVLHIAQPPLSQHLKTLEADYGLQLFERKGRGLLVTEAGLHLYRRACELLNLADEIDADMRFRAEGLAGHVRIGAVTTGLLPLAKVLAELRLALPKVVFSIDQGDPRQLEERVATRELDFALTHWPVNTPGLQTLPLLDLTLVAVENGAGPLAGHSHCQLAELAQVPLIMVRRRQGEGVYERIIQAFGSLGVAPVIAFECTDITGALALAESGAGVALLPVWQGREQAAPLRRVPISDFAGREQLVLMWQADRQPAPAVHMALSALQALAVQGA
ncbi:MAG: LysR family transcriptional regulator [Pseudomonas sp.]|uniref:LysR family transcriptional regulator n=1 Tax=Pseudomonas abieticivorans TaxID=2931382 RepID=UPI0020C14BEE|nr:LysR family transcriptional regulator [Pseudomonas sp. PIA16]MDE1169368.1 LysR family transcriptional regulator [Pseudomonas sp.]